MAVVPGGPGALGPCGHTTWAGAQVTAPALQPMGLCQEYVELWVPV